MADDGMGEKHAEFKGMTLAIEAADDAEAQRVFTALGQDGKVIMALAKTFWTSSFGMLTDRFGVPWMVNVAAPKANPIADLSHRPKPPLALRFSCLVPEATNSLEEKKVMTTHTGSCHCGAVAFDVDGEIDSGLACNCSICSRRASLLWFVPRTALRLRTPESDASTYTFNKHVIKHRFCAKCGIHAFGEGTDPKGNAVAAVNLRCIEDLDLSKVPVKEFDGKSK